MKKADCRLDGIKWHKVERLIKEIYPLSDLTITVYDQNKDETTVCTALGKTQRQDKALSKVIH